MPTREQFRAYTQMPQVRAALDTIAWAEGGAYNRLYGGGTFSGNQHPNQAITAGGYTSTAAGRYQFLFRTWAGIVRNLGLSDFGPENQDIGAVYLIDERGQLANLLAGDFEAVMRGLGCLWAALPYATCGQRRRELAETMNYYRRALAAYGGTAPAPQTQAALAQGPSSGTSDGEWILYGLGAVLLIVLLDG